MQSVNILTPLRLIDAGSPVKCADFEIIGNGKAEFGKYNRCWVITEYPSRTLPRRELLRERTTVQRAKWKLKCKFLCVSFLISMAKTGYSAFWKFTPNLTIPPKRMLPRQCVARDLVRLGSPHAPPRYRSPRLCLVHLQFVLCVLLGLPRFHRWLRWYGKSLY